MISAPTLPSRSERWLVMGTVRDTVHAGKYTGQLYQRRQRDTSLPSTLPMPLQERLLRTVQMSQGSTPVYGSVLLHRTVK